MKRLLTFLSALALVLPSMAANTLQDKTLRLDYVFSGTDKAAEIALDGLCSMQGWWGRNVNMDKAPLRGNGMLTMRDAASGEILYCTSFSTLFQEWQATEEATRVRKSFENVFLVPMPSEPVEVTVELFDFWDKVVAATSHIVDPADILIRPIGQTPAPSEELLHSGSPKDCIDVAIVAEGYTQEEMDMFIQDARAAIEAFFGHEPFRSMASRFNVIAVKLPSQESGISIPGKGIWKETSLGSHFDTFYMARYLTTLRVKKLHDALAGLPYEHIVILANTDNYGGGGIYNSYTLTTAHHKSFRPVVVHEFGHSFGGLADEYYYDDQFVEYYYPEIEPWEKNITTMKDFDSKWKAMMGRDGVSLVEGGGYQSKGVWRACEDCRMKTNTATEFCPVCRRAIEDMINFYTVQQ